MARLDGLTRYLRQTDENQLRMSFAQIERLIGGPLPESARRHAAFWSNSDTNAYAKAWRSAGFDVTRAGAGPEDIVFVRSPSSRRRDQPHAPAMTMTTTLASTSSSAVVVLVGCVATKGDRPVAAKALYTSELFRRRRRYAEASGTPWFIVSALHGLVQPDTVIEPYDQSLAILPAGQRAGWAGSVVPDLERAVGRLLGETVELHAGQDYATALRRPLEAAGATLLTPLANLRIGEQLQWYDRRVPSLPPSAPDRRSLSETADAHDMEPARIAEVVGEVTRAFARGDLDLSRRAGAPVAGWDALPELTVAHRLRSAR